MRTFDYICSSCGEKLKLDLDYKIVYCPLCGKKLKMDMEQVWQLLEGKEQGLYEPEPAINSRTGKAEPAINSRTGKAEPVLSDEEREARMKKAEHRFHVAAFGTIGVVMLIEILAVVYLMCR